MGVCCMYVKLLYNTNVNDIGSVVFFSVCVPETPAKKSTMYFCFQTTARSEELQSVMQEERQVCPTTLLKQLNPSRRERKRERVFRWRCRQLYLPSLSIFYSTPAPPPKNLPCHCPTSSFTAPDSSVPLPLLVYVLRASTRENVVLFLY